MYTIQDARRECKELPDEGYSLGAVWSFLNDLGRGGDITWEEVLSLKVEIGGGITTFA